MKDGQYLQRYRRRTTGRMMRRREARRRPDAPCSAQKGLEVKTEIDDG
jgi:hypothetical protein